MHIDHGIEEQTQEQPLIEEPEDQEPDPQPEEYPQAAPDFAFEEANPSEEGVDWNLIALDSLAALALAPTLGMEFLFCACVGGGTCYHQE
ncbi:hypothetical protein U9M48_008407 [Paspalum notatum var. saurae]|uniref:Uncharacterized protein n=1 Tax=Paspalum notatum var. saurae TaxID=547442 RepID=A0AAQ3WDE2_PASNO